MEPTDREIVDYLLGDIAEADQIRIEDSLFSDETLFERLSVIENRLIDLYVLEKLSPEQRKMFEEKYLVTPRRHSDVTTSTQFMQLVDTYRERQTAKRAKRRAWLPPFFSTHNVAIQFALASLLLITTTGFFWLLTERVRLKNRSEAAEAELRQKESQLQAQAANEQRATAERDALGEQLDQTKELLRLREEELQGRPEGDAPPSFATVVLSLTMRNSSGSPSPELVIRRRDKFARVIVDWEGQVASRYSMSLKRVSDEEEVWKRSVSRSKKRLTAVVPVGVFRDKNYYVRFEALSPDGKQVIGYKEYPLAVRKQ